MEFILANKQDAEKVYEIVDMFCEFHSRDNIMQDIMEGNVYILLDDGELIGTGTKKDMELLL